MASTEDDYDKLTPEQRAERDKVDRAREQEEQAGMHTLLQEPLYLIVTYGSLLQPFHILGHRNWVMQMLLYLYQKVHAAKSFPSSCRRRN